MKIIRYSITIKQPHFVIFYSDECTKRRNDGTIISIDEHYTMTLRTDWFHWFFATVNMIICAVMPNKNIKTKYPMFSISFDGHFIVTALLGQRDTCSGAGPFKCIFNCMSVGDKADMFTTDKYFGYFPLYFITLLMSCCAGPLYRSTQQGNDKVCNPNDCVWTAFNCLNFWLRFKSVRNVWLVDLRLDAERSREMEEPKRRRPKKNEPAHVFLPFTYAYEWMNMLCSNLSYD